MNVSMNESMNVSMNVSMNEPTPLEWWSQRATDRLAHALEATLADWQAAWGVSDPARAAEVANAFEANLEGRTWRACGDAQHAWVSLPDTLAGRIEEALFQADGRAPGLAAKVAQRAADDLLVELSKALKLAPPEAEEIPPAALTRAWSGALAVEVSVCGASLCALLGPATARALLGARPAPPAPAPVTPLGDALQLDFSAELARFSLPVSALYALAPGDVLQLPHRLDAPLTLSAPGTTALSAWLGEAEGARALLLSKPMESTS